MENYTLNSREVAEMVEKEHGKLLKDIRRYSEQLNGAKIGLVEFFKESIYIDGKGESRPCYLVTNEERNCILQSKSAYAIIAVGKKL